MDEKEFYTLTKTIYDKVFEAFEDFDPDEAEADYNLDSVSIAFADGTKFIVNRQTPVRQIWLATKKEGLHFEYDSKEGRWISNRNGEEFFVVLARNVAERIGRPFNFED